MNKEHSDTPKKINPILPPATIGILGGGQLGRMIALEALEMGYNIIALDPAENSPCGQVAGRQIIADFKSMEGAKELARSSDVLTYEFENIGSNIAHFLEKESYLPQGFKLLHTTQNRLREKEAVRMAGVETAPFLAVNSPEGLTKGIEEFGLPCILKTTEGGYDGKGQMALKEKADIEEAATIIKNNPAERVLEKFIAFEKEISVIVARNPNGEIKTFPVAENIHRNNILHLSIAPAGISNEAEKKAEEIALQLAESFQLIGLLAIEMFLLKDGSIMVNELAPRPHNSGHYTQQACITSQFEQHVRAVCNLPLGNTELITPTVMVNILGQHLEPVLKILPELHPDCKVHLYGKKAAKVNRKMGHINVVASGTSEAIKKIDALNIWDMAGAK